MLKSQKTQTGLRTTCQTKQNLIHPSWLERAEPSAYLVGQVSHLDLDRFRQVADGDVPHAARHHVADQRTPSLLALEAPDSRFESGRAGLGRACARTRFCGPTWNRLVLLKNMKLILDTEESSASVRAAPDSSEAGRVTWASGSVRSSKWICRGGRRREGGVQVDPDPARFSAHTGQRRLPEARRRWAPKRR